MNKNISEKNKEYKKYTLSSTDDWKIYLDSPLKRVKMYTEAFTMKINGANL